MKKIVFLLLLFLPLIGWAQDKQHRLGVGLGYSINSVMGDSIRPIELSFKYKLNNKNTLQLYFPIRLKDYRQPSNEKDYTGAKTTQNLFGVGVRYDYARHLKDNLYWIMGLGGDYQWLKVDNYRNYPAENNYIRVLKWEINHKAFSIYPYVGLRYAIENIEIEAYYKPYFALLNIKEKGSHTDYIAKTNEEEQWGSYDVGLKKNRLLQSDISIKIFYKF